MRKLASIKKIISIDPIPCADLIEVANIDGWQVVIKKGDFKAGDKCVYFEIDSFLPMDDRYEFLRKCCFKRMGELDGFRIRTVKLRGVVSQGLLLPLGACGISEDADEGTDLTDILNVKLYEPPLPSNLSGVVKGLFPNFLIKSDQERVQNLTVNKIEDVYEITEKLDGSSMTVYYKDLFGVCSRNLELRESDNNSFWIMARLLDLENVLKNVSEDVGFSVSLQGELVGPGINGNRLNLRSMRFYVFDIINIDKREFLTAENRRNIMAIVSKYNKDILHVPLLGEAEFSQIKKYDTEYWFNTNSDNIISSVVHFAEGKSIVNPDVLREGVVFKKINEGNPHTNFSFKAISNAYLLKHGL
jgi:RNA ligase (TIGR02306 family)